MGKKLIIKGADFSSNGIITGEVDITSRLFSTLYQGGIGQNGAISSKNTRVSGVVVALSEIGASAGDTIKIVTPTKIYAGIRNGSSSSNLPNNAYWYGSDNKLKNSYVGENFTIPSGISYLGFTFGKASGDYDGATATLSTSDIQGYINNKTLVVSLAKNIE